MSEAMKNLGAVVFRECLSSGGDLAAHLNTLLTAPRSQPTADMLAGAILELLRVYLSVRDVVPVPRYDTPAIDAFMHGTQNAMTATLVMKLNPGDFTWLSQYLSELVAVVNAHRDKITFTVAPPTVPTPPPPLYVEIVSLPERLVESKVNYNKKGDITSTTQTERNASAGAVKGR